MMTRRNGTRRLIVCAVVALAGWPVWAQEAEVDAEPAPDTAEEAAADAEAPGFAETEAPVVQYDYGHRLEPPAPPDVETAAAPGEHADVLAETRRIMGEREQDAGPAGRTESRAATSRRSGWGLYVQAFAGLLFVLGLIWVIFHLLRRTSKGTAILGGMQHSQVLGRIYLTPRASLHFVRVADRVLVVGVSPNQVNLVTEMDADKMDTAPAPGMRLASERSKPGGRQDFLSHLIERRSNGLRESGPVPAISDDDIASLRGDIQRLQDYLRESSGGESAK